MVRLNSKYVPFKVDSYINFENVIQICKFAPSAGSKNFIGREKIYIGG